MKNRLADYNAASNRAELAPFIDIAFADDTWSRIYSHSRANAGLGLRALLGETPLRLEVALGQEGLAWFFTIGHAW